MGKQKYLQQMKVTLRQIPVEVLLVVNDYIIWYPAVHYLSLSVEKMYQVLFKEGKVSSSSPKNRKRLYALLCKKQLKYAVQIIENTKTTRSLNRWIAHVYIFPI